MNILTCPKCGGKSVSVGGGKGYHSVHCLECMLSNDIMCASWKLQKPEAIDDWNTRTPSPELQQLRKENAELKKLSEVAVISEILEENRGLLKENKKLSFQAERLLPLNERLNEVQEKLAVAEKMAEALRSCKSVFFESHQAKVYSFNESLAQEALKAWEECK